MFYEIKSYLSFLIKSTNKYGIHSPFVYNLITKCFEKKIDNTQLTLLKKYRTKLFGSKQIINVLDLGAGSRVFSSNNRKVSSIAKNAGISIDNTIILINLIKFLDIKNVLEIGTSLGMGTFGLSLGNSNIKITTLEGCPETQNIAKKQLKDFKIKNIDFVLGNFNTTLKTCVTDKKYDLILFDGNHQKKPTIAYFEQCLQTVHNDSIFIFDDIHWSEGMSEAWSYIKNHEKVTLTIDTFYWGIVFFRKEQFEKEHFILKI